MKGGGALECIRETLVYDLHMGISYFTVPVAFPAGKKQIRTTALAWSTALGMEMVCMAEDATLRLRFFIRQCRRIRRIT